MNTSDQQTSNEMYLFMDTNFNHKLDCDIFLHLDRPPKENIPFAELQKLEVIAKAKDGSHPGTKRKLVDIAYCSFGSIPNLVTYASHGMDKLEYYLWLQRKDPSVNSETKMAIYFYQKID